MTSRTPIRLTPYRGPLATPSTSPESSPTLSTPPTDISDCTTAIRPTIDVTILQHKISSLSPLTGYQHRSRLHRQRRKAVKQVFFGSSTQLSLIVESLIDSVCDLANTVAGIVAFCLLVWGLLEWSSYASELSRQPNPRLLIRQFPLPSRARDLHLRTNPLLYEPGEQHVAVFQFLAQQIQHAKALSTLSINLGLPLRAFFEEHRATIPNIIVRHDSPELSHHFQEVDILANMTELLDSSLLDFTSGSFVGRSFALALDELGDLIFEPMVSRGSSIHGEYPDAHLYAIYWRTTSNLLLEYSAARPRARKLLDHVRVLHERLSAITSGQRAAESIGEKSSFWRRKDIFRPSTITVEDRIQAFVTGLEITLDNIHRLMAYLDRVTEQLAQTTLNDALKIRHHDRTDFSSCLMSLQELFIQSTPSSPKNFCVCFKDHGVTSSRPEKVDIIVPGSPTVRAGR